MATRPPQEDHPMSQWNKAALDSLQGDLKLRVKMSTGLSNKLQKAAGGFMSAIEEQLVKEQHGDSKQMSKLIDILKGKQDKDFILFLRMLRRANYGVWADELVRKAIEFKNVKIHSDFKESLDAALAKGSVEVEIVKCVTLGPPEAGKTQLKEALVGRFDGIRESTPMSTGAEVVMQRYVYGDTSWEPLTRERLRKSIHTTVKDKTFTESTASRSVVMALEQEIQTMPTGVQEGGSLRIPRGSRVESKKVLQESFAAVRASVEEGLEDADPTEVKGLQKMRIVHLIDSGGQPAFFDFHPVIATSCAVYFLVYNMKDEDKDNRKGLDAKPKITYRRKEFPTKDLPNENQSNLSIIKDSLLTLHDCKQKFVTMEGELHHWFGDSISKSADVLPVLVVGTRKREEEVIASESKKLVNECSYLPLWKKVLHCAQTGKKLFAVESIDPTCLGVQSIRKEVDRAGCMYKLQLPISWFFCQLIFWSINEDLHVLTYTDLQDLCQRDNLVASPAEFQAMVRTFHLLGIFSFPYFDQELTLGRQWKPDDKPVFTNPDVLYQQVTKILEITFRDLEKTEMEPAARESLMELQSNGRLDTDTLGHLGIPDQLGSYKGFHIYLLERLVHWGLAARPTPVTCESTGTGRRTYFIPSALPACDKEPLECTDSPFPSLAFTFCLQDDDGNEHHYVPRGIFPHLIVQAEGKGYKIQENTEYEKCLFRDVAIFSIKPSPCNKMQYAYNVTVMDKMDHIAISIDPASKSKVRSSPDECRKIVRDFRDAMKATYKRIYCTSLDVTVACKCTCERHETPLSHLAKIIHSQDGCCELQCLLPRKLWQNDCPPKIKALLYDQDKPLRPGWEDPSSLKARDVLSHKVHDLHNHLVLLRKYVSQQACGRGRAVLEALGLTGAQIDKCYSMHPLNEEESVQKGLRVWIDEKKPTWGDVLRAMETGEIAVQQREALKETLCSNIGSETPNQSNPSPIEPDPASLPCKKADANPAGTYPEDQVKSKQEPLQNDSRTKKCCTRHACVCALVVISLVFIGLCLLGGGIIWFYSSLAPGQSAWYQGKDEMSAGGKRFPQQDELSYPDSKGSHGGPGSSQYNSLGGTLAEMSATCKRVLRQGKQSCPDSKGSHGGPGSCQDDLMARSHGLYSSDAVQILDKHQERFISDMSAKDIAMALQRKGVIPPEVAAEIANSLSTEKANGVLYNHLHSQASVDDLKHLFQLCSEEKGYSRMNTFGKHMLEELEQRGGSVASGPAPGGR